MLCVWVHGCDPGRLSDGSRLTLYQTLSIECPSPIFFRHVCFVLFLYFCRLCFVLFICSCSRWSFVDVPVIFPVQQTTYRIGNHVRILLGMFEARSVNNMKNTTNNTTRLCVCVCFLPIHSGHQVRWTYQPGSHRRKVTQDF